MTATVTATGNLGADPELRWRPDGTPVLSLSIACTPRRQDQTTGQWADDGDPLWIRASLWGRDAETAADLALHRGDRISLTGTLRLSAWTGNDGQARQSFDLVKARFLGVIPRPTPGTHSQTHEDRFSQAGSPQHRSKGATENGPHRPAQRQRVWAGAQINRSYYGEPPF